MKRQLKPRPGSVFKTLRRLQLLTRMRSYQHVLFVLVVMCTLFAAVQVSFAQEEVNPAQSENLEQQDLAQQKDAQNPFLSWLPLVASIIALFGVIIGQLVTYRLSRQNLRTAANQSRNLAEIRRIDELLNNFYGKLVLILARDHLFAQDLRARQKEGYRMLISLFDIEWKNNLNAADKALLEQVCTAAKELDELITENLGEIDGTMIEYFVHASAHFRILHLAYSGTLGDESGMWEKYVYPKPLDPIIYLKCQQLRSRKEVLAKELSAEHSPEKDLQIPKGQMFELSQFPDPDKRFGTLLYGPNAETSSEPMQSKQTS